MNKTIFRAASAALCLAVLLGGCAGSGSSAVSSSAASASASSAPAAASALSDTFKPWDQYDYRSFTHSQSIDESGLWAGLKASDYVTLPEDYAALSIPTATVTPSDDDVQSGIDSIVALYSPVSLGDTVSIDFSGSVDGVKFVNGTASNQVLVLGQGGYIDGFEDQIVGHKVGETFDITVTFPEGYQDSSDAQGNTIPLSGVTAVFSISINAASFAWDVTDDWVAANLENTSYDVSTVEQLTAYVTDRLLRSNKESYAVTYLVEHSTFADPLPETVLDYMVCQCLYSANQYAELNGLALDDFIVASGFDSVDAYLLQEEDSILLAVKESLVNQAVAEAAGITLSAEEAQPYSSYVDSFGQNFVNQYVLTRQVVEYLTANAKMT